MITFIVDETENNLAQWQEAFKDVKHCCLNCGYDFCRMLKRLDLTFKQMQRKTDCKEWSKQ